MGVTALYSTYIYHVHAQLSCQKLLPGSNMQHRNVFPAALAARCAASACDMLILYAALLADTQNAAMIDSAAASEHGDYSSARGDSSASAPHDSSDTYLLCAVLSSPQLSSAQYWLNSHSSSSSGHVDRVRSHRVMQWK
jgi:hypothetical protein